MLEHAVKCCRSDNAPFKWCFHGEKYKISRNARIEKFGINHWKCICTFGTSSWFSSLDTCIRLCSVFKDCQPWQNNIRCVQLRMTPHKDKIWISFVDGELKYIRQIKYLQALNNLYLRSVVAIIRPYWSPYDEELCMEIWQKIHIIKTKYICFSITRWQSIANRIMYKNKKKSYG